MINQGRSLTGTSYLSGKFWRTISVQVRKPGSSKFHFFWYLIKIESNSCKRVVSILCSGEIGENCPFVICWKKIGKTAVLLSFIFQKIACRKSTSWLFGPFESTWVKIWFGFSFIFGFIGTFFSIWNKGQSWSEMNDFVVFKETQNLTWTKEPIYFLK